MILEGRVENIVFYNADNGYTVLELDSNGTLITVTGNFPPLLDGQILQLDGKFISNPRYGEQFNATDVKTKPPTSREAIIRYLSSDLFKGIGPVTAEKIVDHFGSETLSIIEFQPHKLADVKGLNAKKAFELANSITSLKKMQDVIIFLQGYNLSLNLALKIYKVYEERTKEVIMENPYQLVEDIDGIGFIIADEIAKKTGIENKSKFRITAGIVHTLKQDMLKSGHTYLTQNNLIRMAGEILQIDYKEEYDLFKNVLEEMEIKGKIVVLTKDEKQIIMLSYNFMIEKAISMRLITLLTNAKTYLGDIENDVKEFERVNNIVMHESQKTAVIESVNEGISVITGGPGTGKTTIIKCIVNVLEARNIKYSLCAPTGRAAKRLSEATGVDAKTIHRMLKLEFGLDGRQHFAFNNNEKLDAEYIIIDEISMCDEYIFYAVLEALNFGSKLILVGDKDQLASVGAGNVLADIINSKVFTVNYLTHIYRQSQDSLIITNAHMVNRGEMPILDNSKSDFFFSSKNSPEEVKNGILDFVINRLPKFSGVNARDIQVLCPQKKSLHGVDNMNIELQKAINPPAENKPEIKYGATTFRLGDKVIHIMNNYQLEWIKQFSNETGTGVFNGDIGFISNIDKKRDELTVCFEDGKLVKYPHSIMMQIQLAYAITVHKAQGCEFDVCVISIMSGSYMILTKNLLYTAITRAKKMVMLVGSKENLETMIKNNFTAKRNSMLLDFILEEYKKKC
ncbi:MAG: ATP-dependent RecD-like DNA helicase [Clostridia bacterium]